jgi:hypothetical protein
MKKSACILLIICMAFLSSAQVTFSHLYNGVGFHLALDVFPDEIWYDANAAFDIGGQGDIAFSLGKIGEIHYCPSLGVLLGGGHEVDWHTFVMEWYFNIADARYYFPLPNAKVKPYIGLGPMFAIDYYKNENDHWPTYIPPNPPTYGHVEIDDSDFDIGMNFFTGVDVSLLPGMLLTGEFRGKLGNWDMIKLLAELTFLIGGTR